MTESNLDDYINKLGEIKTASENYLTTQLDIETLLSELVVLDDAIDDNAIMPITIAHLNKLILSSIIRVRKSDLQHYLYTLIKTRQEHQLQDAINNVGTQEEQIIYQTETRNIITYINNIKNSCPCMSNRCSLIKYEAFN